jgi:hypothetical protein
MRRSLAAIPVLALLLAAGPAGYSGAARQSTPAAGEATAAALPEGVVAEALVTTHLADLPPAPAELRLIRLRLAPGATVPTDPANPSLKVVYVERGELSVRVDAPVTVYRGPELATQLARIEAGLGSRLDAGQGFVFPPFTAGELRNAGTGRVLVLTTVLELAEATAATPAP